MTLNNTTNALNFAFLKFTKQSKYKDNFKSLFSFKL